MNAQCYRQDKLKNNIYYKTIEVTANVDAAIIANYLLLLS